MLIYTDVPAPIDAPTVQLRPNVLYPEYSLITPTSSITQYTDIHKVYTTSTHWNSREGRFFHFLFIYFLFLLRSAGELRLYTWALLYGDYGRAFPPRNMFATGMKHARDTGHYEERGVANPYARARHASTHSSDLWPLSMLFLFSFFFFPSLSPALGVEENPPQPVCLIKLATVLVRLMPSESVISLVLTPGLFLFLYFTSLHLHLQISTPLLSNC